MTQNDIVQKLWNLCDVLRDDGINYSDYVTELVLLLFIKMVHENTENGTLQKHTLPEGCRWTDINAKSGLNLMNDYKRILLSLSTGKDADDNNVHEDPLISAIYADAQTRLREPRALISSMVNCIKPQIGETIQDPAAGTAGFLIAADSYLKAQTDDYIDLTQAQASFQKNKAFIGVELVPSTRRLALMNCLLHGMEGDDEGVVHLGNALGQVGASLAKADIILANPPFGTAKGGEASITRDDLTYKTSNKQLAFLQHIYRNLKAGGRAAVVLPDNVLFEAGVGTDVRRDLMNKCNLHTILRLPTGIFYAQGVKTNVLFFTKGSTTNKLQDENCTQNVWVYDLRANMPSFGKRTPFGEQHLTPFEAVYGDKSDGTSERTAGEWSFTTGEQTAENSRWQCFSRDYIRTTKGDSLDISWLKDNDSVDAANLPEPDVLAAEAMSELTEALRELDGLMQALGAGDQANTQKQLLAEVLGFGEDI